MASYNDCDDGNLISGDSNNTTLKDLLRISTDSLKTQEILELLKKTLSENLFFIKYYEYMELLQQMRAQLNEGRMAQYDPRLNHFYKKHFPLTPEEISWMAENAEMAALEEQMNSTPFSEIVSNQRSAGRKEEAVERMKALRTKHIESKRDGPQLSEEEKIELTILDDYLGDPNHKWGGAGKKRKNRKKRKSKKSKSKKKRSKKRKRSSRKSKTKRRR